MKNILAIFKKQDTAKADLKNRIVKNREALLDVMSSKIEGARSCPFLVGQKCIGQMCERFMEFSSVTPDGKETKFWRCADVQVPVLLIEIAREIRQTNKLLAKMIDKK